MPKTKSNYKKQIKYRASSQWVELLDKGKKDYLLRTFSRKYNEIENDNETLELYWKHHHDSGLLRLIMSTSSSDFYRIIVLKWFFENLPELLHDEIPELIELKDLIRFAFKD